MDIKINNKYKYKRKNKKKLKQIFDSHVSIQNKI